MLCANGWHLKHSGSPFKLHTHSCVGVVNADTKFIFLRLNVIFKEVDDFEEVIADGLSQLGRSADGIP